MKKLTVAQWIAFLSAVVGIIFESGILGDSIQVNEILSKALVILGLAKVIYDLFMSYQAEDVANFANANNESLQRKSYTKQYTAADVKAWQSKRY